MKTQDRNKFGQILQTISPALNLIPGAGTIASTGANMIGSILNQPEQKMNPGQVLPQVSNPYMYGGQLQKYAFGGPMKQYNAPSHQMGGQMVDPNGNPTMSSQQGIAEIEKQETYSPAGPGDGFVFSDQIRLPNGMTIAQKAAEIEKKYGKFQDAISKAMKQRELAKLAKFAEKEKARIMAEQQMKMQQEQMMNSQRQMMEKNDVSEIISPRQQQQQQQQNPPQEEQVAQQEQQPPPPEQESAPPQMKLGGNLTKFFDEGEFPFPSFGGDPEKMMERLKNRASKIGMDQTTIDSFTDPKELRSEIRNLRSQNRMDKREERAQNRMDKKMDRAKFRAERFGVVEDRNDPTELTDVQKGIYDETLENKSQPRPPFYNERTLSDEDKQKIEDYSKSPRALNKEATQQKKINRVQSFMDENNIDEKEVRERAGLKDDEEITLSALRKAKRDYKKENNQSWYKDLSGLDKTAFWLKGAGLVASGLDALKKPEIQAARLPNFAAQDQYFSETGIDPQAMLNQANLQKNAAVQQAARGAGSYGQFLNRVNAAMRGTQGAQSQALLSAKQYNDQMAAARGMRGDKNAAVTSQIQMATDDINAANRAQTRNIRRNFFNQLSQAGTTLNQIQYMKDAMANQREIADMSVEETMMALGVTYPEALPLMQALRNKKLSQLNQKELEKLVNEIIDKRNNTNTSTSQG